MQVIEKNIGPKVDYEASNTYLAFRESELLLDLAKYERDFLVHIDICENEFGMLTMGVSRKYVAQIDIPAREYELIMDDADGEEGSPAEVPMPVPFDIDKVTLTLWATEGGNE